MNSTPTPPTDSAPPVSSSRPGMTHAWFRDRALRLAAGLAVVVAIPVAVLFYFQFRALNDLEEASAVVLRQLSGDTVDSLSREIEEALKRPHINVLLRTGQGRLEPLDLAFIDPVLAEGLTESPFIEEFWLWSENAAARSGRMLVFDRGSLMIPITDVDRRFRYAPTRAAELVPMLHEFGALRRAIVAFSLRVDGRQKYVQVQLRFEGPERQRVTSFLGFMVDAEYLHDQYFPSLVQRRLEAVQQSAGFPPLELYLSDGDGKVVFAPAKAPSSEVFVDERQFPLVFFDKELLEYAAPYEQRRETWRVRAGFGVQTIPEIVSASTRPQLALMVVLAIVMALGVFFVAGAAAREVRVAELKSNFVASVSHDLKTPLALIQLFAETLEVGRVRNAERAQEYYRIINAEARKLTRLIENILDFSRMEAGLRPYRTELADVATLTANVLSSMSSQLTQSRFEVHARIDQDLPRVLVDENAVVQAIENLLANAMKYSASSRDIDVEVARRKNHVCVSVTDHGIGIPRREQSRIFRKFYRVEGGLGGGPQGCGLGLAIVDHTMRGHGGFVRVESEPDHGSTFTLHFPIPVGLSVEGTGHEADSGDRGRTADVARSA
ncbi:MAG: sensor histidine kinase [Acidobacteriota bacterium]